MSARFSSGKKALAECDICGFRYKLRELRTIILKGKETNLKACPECWNPGHPQLRLGEYLVHDPQAIRDPRPDSAGYASSRAMTVPVRQVVGSTKVGQVKVEIS